MGVNKCAEYEEVDNGNFNRYWNYEHYLGGHPLRQVSNAEIDAPSELELADIEDWATDSELGIIC